MKTAKCAGVSHSRGPLATVPQQLSVPVLQLYLALWYYDQLPAAFFALLMYFALKPKLFPPSPEEVQRRLAERRARSKEAQELDEDVSKREKVGELSKSLAQSVGVAALMGGINITHTPSRVKVDQPAAVPIGALDDYSSDSELDEPHYTHHIVPVKKRRGKYGMYRLIRELLHRFGPSTMLLINDAADYLEKIKK